MHSFFVSDLHGREDRYRKLFGAIRAERPAAVFLGGDLLPSCLARHAAVGPDDFLHGFLEPALGRLRDRLGPAYPRVFVILGNDDARSEEASVLDLAERGLWEYVHGERVAWLDFDVFGYAYVPPTPFALKDWERYDVSRFVDPGCCPPAEGWRTFPVDESEVKYATIREDLDALVGPFPCERAIVLFHAPPYRTALDRAALDGVRVEHVPVDVHVGSIAIRRFIEARQPRLTLHGHVHESARLTGEWRETIGHSVALSAAHDGPELALVRFDPNEPSEATRELI